MAGPDRGVLTSPPAQVNELHLTRTATGGGKIKGRFDDAAMFDAIAAVVDVKARPLTGDDDRTAGQRQAEALADVCGHVLDHGRPTWCRSAAAIVRT
jgi:5-methylcytosine-specific restriction protein A